MTNERVRVRIVSASGTPLGGGFVAADPPQAAPHFSQEGWMTEEPCPLLGGALNPRIVLDDGSILWGCECWWEPVEEVPT